MDAFGIWQKPSRTSQLHSKSADCSLQLLVFYFWHFQFYSGTHIYIYITIIICIYIYIYWFVLICDIWQDLFVPFSAQHEPCARASKSWEAFNLEYVGFFLSAQRQVSTTHVPGWASDAWRQEMRVRISMDILPALFCPFWVLSDMVFWFPVLQDFQQLHCDCKQKGESIKAFQHFGESVEREAWHV